MIWEFEVLKLGQNMFPLMSKINLSHKIILTPSEQCVVLNLLKFHSNKIDLTWRSTKVTYCIDPQIPEMLEFCLGPNMKLVGETRQNYMC